jgi:hypothetical protein
MDKHDVVILSKQPNCVILKLPWRTFPSVALQGDSLSILVDLSESLAVRLKNAKEEEVTREMAEELSELLRAYLNHYKYILKQNNIALPFPEK